MINLPSKFSGTYSRNLPEGAFAQKITLYEPLPRDVPLQLQLSKESNLIGFFRFYLKEKRRSTPAWINLADWEEQTKKSFPHQGWDTASMRPSCASISVRLIARPSPRPVDLVLWNGWKSFSAT